MPLLLYLSGALLIFRWPPHSNLGPLAPNLAKIKPKKDHKTPKQGGPEKWTQLSMASKPGLMGRNKETRVFRSLEAWYKALVNLGCIHLIVFCSSRRWWIVQIPITRERCTGQCPAPESCAQLSYTGVGRGGHVPKSQTLSWHSQLYLYAFGYYSPCQNCFVSWLKIEIDSSHKG